MASVPVPSPQTTGFAIRVATEADLADITRVHIEGFTEEPQVHHCYPKRHQYPEDHWEWMKGEYFDYLEQPEKYLVHVLVSLSSGTGVGANPEPTRDRPVGVAVWNLAVLSEAIGNPGLDQRRDFNRKRLEAFMEKSGERFKTYFAKWGADQVNLSALVVQPDFRRRGGGTMLVSWGIKRAEEKGWPATLCASPMGQLLYKHLGFETIATEVVQLQREEESLVNSVIVLAGEDKSATE